MVRTKVRVRARVMVRIKVRVRARVWIRVRVRVKARVRIRLRVTDCLSEGYGLPCLSLPTP